MIPGLKCNTAQASCEDIRSLGQGICAWCHRLDELGRRPKAVECDAASTDFFGLRDVAAVYYMMEDRVLGRDTYEMVGRLKDGRYFHVAQRTNLRLISEELATVALDEELMRATLTPEVRARWRKELREPMDGVGPGG